MKRSASEERSDSGKDQPDGVRHPDWFDMQGLVLSGYPDQDQAQYLLYTIDPGNVGLARLWLQRIFPAITRASRYTQTHLRSKVNIALTATGLAKLVGPDSETSNPARIDAGDFDAVAARLQGFPDAFVEGIARSTHRSRILGHTGTNDPTQWAWGGPKRPVVDVLLMVFADKHQSLDACVQAVQPPYPAMTPAGNLKPALRLGVANRREHFGFADGISQPILVGSDDAERFPESMHLTALGEIVLGYSDSTGNLRCGSTVCANCRLGRNGSYLVLNQLEQDVRAFWEFAHAHTMHHGQPDPAAAAQLASKIVGRWPDGTPLVPYVNRDDNEFGFANDPYGYGCPLGSHVRRANPRDSFENANEMRPDSVSSNRHRIMRRGRSYGSLFEASAPTDERGLYFICLNADLEQQFEFVQQNWINNTGFLGLNDERDPLIGDRQAPHANNTMTVPALPAPVCTSALNQFVSVRGGEYFFMPGLRAIDYLASVDNGR
jgi:Dyp-type peroxidase family